MLSQRHRPGPRGESGQALVVILLMMTVLLGMAALVIDVGYAYYTQRSLQASADAAALAGAQQLPSSSAAIATAKEYGGAVGAKNARGNVPGVTTSVSTKCVTTIPGCDPAVADEVNVVVVLESAPARTFFAGLFGIDSLKVKVKSTACSPCGVKPLDIMMVLDRTGSMCLTSSGANDPACTDLNNAKDGIKTFLTFLDPATQWVGLAVLPPPPGSDKCQAPAAHTTTAANTAYKTTSPYVIVPLSKDYLKNGALNSSSNLVSTINCTKGAGYTAYANALEAAQKQLETNGRAGVKDVIVFLSDGAANIGPSDLPLSSSYRKQPCHQGVWSAATIKGKGTKVYSIGYDLNALGGGANVCQTTSSSGAPGGDESPAITAYSALQQIASPGGFYNKPSPGQLRGIFSEIAADLARGQSALIDG
jgi:hypothetical protein